MKNQSVLFLNKEDIAKCVSMQQMIESMHQAFIQLSAKQVVAPMRTHIEIEKDRRSILFMPAFASNFNKACCKIVSVFNTNPARGLPMIQALVIVVDAENGLPQAILDGSLVTALRTGAASGMATDLLSNLNAEKAALFGAGMQGRTQIEAICAVRQLKEILVFDIDQEKAKTFSQQMQKRTTVPCIASMDTQKLCEVDIICTATPSQQPLFPDVHLKPGVHINAVGAYTPEMCEIPPETVRRAKIIVDSKDACLEEAGDIIQPLRNGIITEKQIYAEVGEICSGNKTGRESSYEITFFKSVGHAVQDLAAADLILKNANELKVGTTIPF